VAVATRAAILILAVTVGAASARAQDERPTAARSDQARSRALYDQGSRAYSDGDYARAIELFLAAYELSRAPAILFNVAQAYRLAGTCDKALEYYRRSLAEEPDAANRAEVEERIAEMQRCAADEQARRRAEPPAAARAEVESAASEAEDAPPATPPGDDALPAVSARAPERPPARRSLLPLVTVGVGAAAALAGGVLYLEARAKFAEVEPTCPCEPGSFSGWETATGASYVLMGAGVVAAGAGLVWWWRQARREPARIGLVPTARGVAWAGSF
jgi:tetratricopeptide (TPR) repeat protein